MNSPNALRALLEKRPPLEPAPAASPATGDDEYQAFAHGRIGNRPQLTLIFRQADGSVRAFPYAYLSLIESDDPATGFTLHFPPHRVRVTGRNLTRLFQLVCQHRAAEVKEVGQASPFTEDERDAFVSSIGVDFVK